MTSAAWGIDLGTTNSCIARADANGVEVISIDEAPTVPSVLAWNGEEFLIGRRASNHAVIAPDHAVRSIKRHMGEEGYRVRLGEQAFTAIEVSARILEYLKNQAQMQTGEAVTEAVITVPAWFGEPQRRATLLAGDLAGLKVSRILNEPTAAGLAFGHTGTSRAAAAPSAAGERWMVYDLGGGTFDVSILEVAGNYKEVLASCGNTYLGGDDFDHRIALHCVDRLRDRHNVDVVQDRLALAQLRHLAEQVKIRLSTEIETPVRAFIESAGKKWELSETLTRHQFEHMIQDYVDSTVAKARQALEEAHVTPGQLSRILLVGGSTRIPSIRERIAREFGIEPDAYVDVDLSVALGAALQSALDHALSASQIVVDIAPHALGVAALGAEDHGDFAADGIAYPRTFAPIIRKNSRLPAKFVEEFYTAADGQSVVEVVVLQGESKNTRENTLVGVFRASFDPKPYQAPIGIGFEYDRNGMVRVFISDQGGTKLLKSHTLDLGRSAQANSELEALSRLSEASTAAEPDDWEENPDEAEDGFAQTGAMAQTSQLTNFLIEQVERRLADVAAGEHDSIRADLESYRALLAQGRDADLDEVEERLYAWLDGAQPQA